MRAVLILAAALALIAYAALAGGREWLGPQALFAALTDGDFVVQGLRLPRLLLALGAGCALGLAGALLQGLTRNILATPDILGIVQMAGLGHLIALAAGASLLAGEIAGAGLALGVLAWLGRGAETGTQILYGIGLAATASAAGTVVLLRLPDAAAAQAMLWLSGSLARAELTTALPLFATLGLALGILATQARALPLLWLGDEVMAGLGTDLRRLRWVLLALIAALTAAATLAVGPIGFLAFTAAPLAQAITGAPRPALLPAMLMGGALLALADLAARMLAGVVNLPTGLVMTMIGASYLVGHLSLRRGGTR